jgi:uncharacterized protein YeaO (DUF488 family)
MPISAAGLKRSRHPRISGSGFTRIEGRFKTFSERYAKELEDSPAVGEFIRSIPEGTDRVTLLYAAKAGAPSHVGTLKAALEKAAAAISLKK